jgi:protein-S-isoprenylcysteine O-methyltransferase Ste14
VSQASALADNRRMRRPGLGTALFALLGPPAGATVLVPWLLSGWRLEEPFFGWQPWRWIGVAVLAVGAFVAADSMTRFARIGRGTPAPWAPTERFVAMGLYRLVRNPMYVGMLLVVIGEGLLFASWPVLAWAALLGGLFHLFVVFVEEPSLRARFGAAYDVYCGRVGRWLPRVR